MSSASRQLLNLTDNAKEALINLLKKSSTKASMLKLHIINKGCAGHCIELKQVEKTSSKDRRIAFFWNNHHGELYIDKDSILHLAVMNTKSPTFLDHICGDFFKQFSLSNSASDICSCGKSFSIKNFN